MLTEKDMDRLIDHIYRLRSESGVAIELRHDLYPEGYGILIHKNGIKWATVIPYERIDCVNCDPVDLIVYEIEIGIHKLNKNF